MPEILTFRNDEVLLVHGMEAGRSFWWPPGAYWILEPSCDLKKEQPEHWIKRVLKSQVAVKATDVSLFDVQHVAPDHAPVMVYEVQTEGTPEASASYDFDDARYFPMNELPSCLGRDDAHGNWLKNLLSNFGRA